MFARILTLWIGECIFDGLDAVITCAAVAFNIVNVFVWYTKYSLYSCSANNVGGEMVGYCGYAGLKQRCGGHGTVVLMW